MNDRDWTRQERLALGSVVVAVVACALTFVVPEVRRWFGLGSNRSTTLRTSDPAVPKSDVDRTVAEIFEHDPSAEPALPTDVDNLVADGRPYYVVFRPSAYVKRLGEALLPITKFVFHDPRDQKRWVAVEMYSDYLNSRTTTLEILDHVYGDNYRYRTSLLAGITDKAYKDTIKSTEFEATLELLNVITRPDTTEAHAREFVAFTVRLEVSPIAAAEQRD